MIPSGAIKTKRRVLLIESSPSERLLLRFWLNAEGIEVHEAFDIVSGLAACPTFQPNLILVQLRLPTWDGLEVIRRLKNDPQTLKIPVILMADYSTTAEKAKGIDTGAVDFVNKPFDPIELMARVNSALRTKAYLDLLDQRAHIDGLTELNNRAALQDRLPQIWNDCAQKGVPLSLMVADLDHFKQINDKYGHGAGDEVLRRAATTLRGAVRGDDFIARAGGEEFVVLAPDCDLKGALGLAERFRAAIADLRIPFRSATLRVTSSVGVAPGLDSSQAGPEEALHQADQALYAAKRGGRDTVRVWDLLQGCAVSPNELKVPEPPDTSAEQGGTPQDGDSGSGPIALSVHSADRGITNLAG